jgi:hypothetical protein
VASDLPGKGLGDLLVTLLEGEQTFGQNVEVSQVVRSEYLALDHREVDLDLVEPGGVHRKMDEFQVGPLALQTLQRGLLTVRRAVVYHPEDPIRRGVGCLSHHLLDKAVEGFDPVFSLAATEEPGAVDVPGGQVG